MVQKKALLIVGIVLLVLAGILFAWKLLYHRPLDLLSQLEEGEYTQEHLTEVTLTFILGGQKPQATQEALDQVERKLKNSLNIKLKFIFKGFSSGDMAHCDAFYYRDNLNSPMDLKTIIKRGAIKDITEEFQRLAPRYYQCLSPEELERVMVDGKIYAIPQHFYTAQTRCAIVREDLMVKYQIPEIKNFDDFEGYLKIIKAKEPGLVPLIFNDNSVGLFAEPNGYVILNNQLGLVYKWDDPNLKIVAWEQTDAFHKGIDILSRWRNNGYLFGATAIDDQMVSSGKWASFIAPFGSEITYNAILKSKNISWRYKAYPLNSGHSSARSPSPGMLLLNSQSKNVERIFMFINWLYSKQENYDLLMFGIKGKHYQLEGDRIKLLSRGVALQENPYTWIWHEALCNIDFERVPESSPADSAKVYREFLETNSKYPPLMGFNPDWGSIQETMPLRQIKGDDIEYSIYNGFFKTGDGEEYIQDQKQAGIDRLVAEVQRKVDQWKAENKTGLTANERE